MENKCVIKRCRNEEDINYLGKPICRLHWFRHCDEDDCFNLKQELEIKEEKENV